MSRDYSVFEEGTLVRIIHRQGKRAAAGTLGLFIPPSPSQIPLNESKCVNIRIMDKSNPYVNVRMSSIEFVAPPLKLKVGDRVIALTTMGDACSCETVIEALELRQGQRARAQITVRNRTRTFPTSWMMPLHLSNSDVKQTLNLI